MSDFATKAFLPCVNEMSYYIDGTCDTFKAKLTSAGELDYVTFSYYYDDGFFQSAANVKITYTNVGTTELPFEIAVL